MSRDDDNVIVTEDNLRVVFDDMGGMAMAEALLAGEVMAAVGQHDAAKASGDVLAELEAAKVLMALLQRLTKPRRAVILQNRDRSTPAMIAQMTAIAAMPDYFRVAPTKEFASGTPIVFGNDDARPSKIAMGRADKAVAADGRRFQVQYAVVEADDLLTSNTADGLAVADYASGIAGKLRAIAGNGRLAGLKGGYARGTAAEYRRELAEDDSHGVAPAELERFDAPILVRIMRAEDVTENIGDISNQRGTSDLSPVEQAQNDSKRLNLADLDVADDGKPTETAALAFIASMPESERNNLMDGKHPGQKAYDRLMASVFWQAYSDSELVRLYAQSVDAEIKTILGGMASAAAELARLEGAGDLDIRSVVTEAASLAVNAKRQGVKLADFAKQTDLTLSADTMDVVRMFVENIRSAKKIGERLRSAARFAYEEFTKDDTDMFGTVEKATRAQVLERLAREPEEPTASLFDSVDPVLALQLVGQLVQKTAALKAADGDPIVALQLAGEVVAIIKQLQAEAEGPVATVASSDLGAYTPGDMVQMREAAKAYMAENLVQPVHNLDMQRDILFQRKGLKKILSFSSDPRKLALLPALRTILAHGKDVSGPKPSRHNEPDVKAVHVLKAKVTLDGKPLTVRVIVKEKQDGTVFYDHAVDRADLGGSTGILDSVVRTEHSPTALLPGEPSPGQVRFDSVLNPRQVINLFIEEEEPEEAPQEPDTAPNAGADNAELAAPTQQPQPNTEPSRVDNLHKIKAIITTAADDISKLRRIDVDRMLGHGERHHGSTLRGDMADYIVANRPDLADEVRAIMSEEYPDVQWSGKPAAAPVSTVQTPGGADVSPANPARAADLAFLRSVASQSLDMWGQDVGDRLEAVVAAYPDDGEVQAEWVAAVNAYTDFMAKAIAHPA